MMRAFCHIMDCLGIPHPIRRVSELVVLFGALFAGSFARFASADAVGYAGVVDLNAQTAALSAKHHRDWSNATHDARWKMFSDSRDVFAGANNYAYVVVFDRKTGQQIFKSPSPACSYLWISPGSSHSGHTFAAHRNGRRNLRLSYR
jgi:hypothetical protein